MHTEAFNVAVVRWDTPVIKEPGEHVATLRNVREEVSNAPAFLDVSLRVGLQSVDDVRELQVQENRQQP